MLCKKADSQDHIPGVLNLELPNWGFRNLQCQQHLRWCWCTTKVRSSAFDQTVNPRTWDWSFLTLWQLPTINSKTIFLLSTLIHMYFKPHKSKFWVVVFLQMYSVCESGRSLPMWQIISFVLNNRYCLVSSLLGIIHETFSEYLLLLNTNYPHPAVSWDAVR